PSTSTTNPPTTTTGVPVIMTLEANIEGATINVNKEGPYHAGDFITLVAEEVQDNTFLHWFDLDQESIVGTQSTISFALTRNTRLQAVYVLSTEARLSIYTNSPEASEVINQSGDYDIGSNITIIAETIDNQRFLHWYDALSDTIVSTDNPYSFTVDSSLYLVAVYERLQPPTVTYATGFEDSVKSSYDSGQIIADDEPWLLNEALVGSLENDQKIDSKSVRIGNGYIQTEFAMTGMASLSFMYGRYLGDTASVITAEVSIDKTNWITIGELLADAMQNFTFVFEASWFDAQGFNSDVGLYLRITSPTTQRVNIDNVEFERHFYETTTLPVIFMDVSELAFPDNSERVEISFTANHKEFFSYGETWEASYCLAEDNELGSMACSVYGSVDTSDPGTYEVTYYVIDIDGNYASEKITYVVLKDASLLDVDYTGYYDGIEGLYGEELLQALRLIIQTGAVLQTYDDARVILADADVDPGDANSVLTIYTHESVPRIWDAESWHREHVWPNSRLGVARVDGSDRSIASDLHNLRAIVPSVNSSRSNKVFSSVTTTDTYYPGEDIGDVARILFYMLIMYPELSMTDEILPNDPLTNYTLAGAKMAMWTLCFDWNDTDPVSAFEINRNNVIYSYQFNRNPFIDYPYLADLIWFDDPAVNIPD
ncbi:MAG: endonuclease, partial [Bacilli bacterium]|nr:endonuclease [Bacilli bacterium]